ncbi:AraD1 family protein [Aurantiacibacter poecillastricola]|uniref:AraD1 family protein n=1 Tax=Aurantiacibacter poecillastricola TaxID=3064385 RepID=UPI00273E588B|nr:AraD1 family protein [Aurantiacibacter sp. 219JJ12-13]MDP5260270.1 GguC family protein [Aurantiacibacter sp. 219JJ12-13]
MAMILMQRRGPDGGRQVLAAIDGETRPVLGVRTTMELAQQAIASGQGMKETAEKAGLGDRLDPQVELAEGRLLSPIDHPDPAHLVLAGTGLTHLGSAEGRDRMHKAAASGDATDSMRMFLEGLEGGKPSRGAIGQQPEWFWKGDGQHLAAPEAPLSRPSYARDGGEEPEIAGIYLIGPDGSPHRLGFALANEYSDHVTEKHNYLWLAHSKLRQASLGPELLLGDLPEDIRGTARIRRDGEVAWEKPFLTGEANMAHSIANLEHHHFKYALFRRPGDIHVHFFGTSTASFADGFVTQDGDTFEIEAPPFTLPLRNRLSVDGEPEQLVAVERL